MSTQYSWIKRHALLAYFLLTFVISWGAILILVGPGGILVAPDQAVSLGMAILLGPTLACFLLTGLTSGRAGFRELFTRLFRRRVSVGWYAVALLTAPLSTAAALLILSLFSPEFVPSIFNAENKVSALLMGLLAGLFVGIFEELGWTGFAIPRMRLRRGIFATGLITGLIWGAWHFILFWEGDSFSAWLPLLLLLARLFAWLPAYRILMVWVYDRTDSLLVVILMHLCLVATLVTIDPALSGGSLLAFILVRAGVLWVLAALVIAARRRPAM